MCSKYFSGASVWHDPWRPPLSAVNSLPEGWRVGYTLKPFAGKHKRGHLQFKSPHIDYVMRVLENAEPPETPEPWLNPTSGLNYVETPCTEPGSMANALEERQRLKTGTRPWVIPDRHARGYQKELKKLVRILATIVRQKEPEKPDPLRRYEKYSGSKRAHYQQCAYEHASHPIGTRDGATIFHEGQVKWGEISARPRALLVQSVRAKGTVGVKPGMVLRSPIMVEGGYRDLFEDALHKFCHRRGFHFVASGMDLHRRGRIIKKIIEPGDEVLSCDWSSFDGSLGWLAVWERREFLQAVTELFGADPALAEVLRTQDFCTVQAGPLHGQIFGNRGSGTAGTSTANKICVLAALFYALGPAMRGAGGCKLFCDGDDTLIIVPKQWQGQRWYDSWVKRMTHLGLETKVEQKILDTTAEEASEGVRFCRAGVISTSRGWFLCKKPLDAMKVMTNFRRHFRGPRFRDYLQTLSVGTRDVYGDVPILCGLHRLFDVGGRFDQELYDSAGMEYMLQLHKSGAAGAINEQHRISFWRTWGIPVDQQIRAEQALYKASEVFRELLIREQTW